MGKHEVNGRAVFLDRDGVLNYPIVRDRRPHSPTRIEEFKLYEEAAESCSKLKAAGFLLVVVTNQPDVGRGVIRREIVETMNASMRNALPALDAIEVCYHAGANHGAPCDCRKPAPGMLFRSAARLRINLAESYLIGDRWRDVNCARNAGCRAVFIDRGYDESLRATPDLAAGSLREAVDLVLHDAVARCNLPIIPSSL